MRKRNRNKKTRKRGKKKAPKLNVKKLSLILVATISVVVAGCVYLWYRKRFGDFVEKYNNYQPVFAPGDLVSEYVGLSEERSFNLLFLGLDQKESGHIKADAVMIVHYDSVSEHFQIFEIPSKTQYYWPEKDDYVELSNVYAIGQLRSPESGFSLVHDLIEYNLAIRTDAYVALDMDGLAHLVGGLGNLRVQNEESFTDNDLQEEDLKSSFNSGYLDLSPKESVAFVRADENGFYAKSSRHYSIIQSLLESLRISDLYEALGTFGEIDSHVFSNLQGDSIRRFVRLLSDESLFTFDYYPLDSVWSNVPGIDESVFDRIKFDDFVASTFDNGEVIREQARIEVYNSTDIPGLASRYTRILQNMGCDIIRKANTGSSVSKTLIFTETPDLFPLTIAQIKKVVGTDVEVKLDSPGFVTTGDLVVILADDVEDI